MEIIIRAPIARVARAARVNAGRTMPMAWKAGAQAAKEGRVYGMKRTSVTDAFAAGPPCARGRVCVVARGRIGGARERGAGRVCVLLNT
ncbi:hypothetical protein AcdelDRAFT_2975 [Acidovorax delafieldii 2AN]|uniref:Uncharacterized protein n=1 Tax=Acidovorax delafieldii 2AN TaxID=573060 RepID=C5T7U5_ACIDE|nr:hypothetical protein AcdelDRAFT_2975 [Acidovorax delafieldii 2AN]